MKKITLFMLVSLLIAVTVQAFPPAEKKDFVGEWKFENPHAPYGYQQGVFSLQEKEDALEGELKFSDGYKVKLKNMVVTDGVLQFGMDIESYYVTVKAKVEGEKLKGAASTPDGDLPFEAVKVKKDQP